MLQLINELFDTRMIHVVPTEEEQEVLDRRDEIEQEFPPYFSLELYAAYYKLFREYGLDDKMLQRVEHEIWYSAQHPDEFEKSTFYQQFCHKKLVKKHMAGKTQKY